MKYFSNLPKITYNIEGYDSAEIRNLFYNLNIVDIDSTFLDVYNIQSVERLDTISYNLYGTTDYWWVIASLNEIQDIFFDLPVDEDIIQLIASDYALEKYGDLSDPASILYQIEKFNELVLENDAKRVIKVINPIYINSFITDMIKVL